MVLSECQYKALGKKEVSSFSFQGLFIMLSIIFNCSFLPVNNAFRDFNMVFQDIFSIF